jgi:hypothetical protein
MTVKTWAQLNPTRVMLNNARARARRKKVPFDIELDDIKIPDRCPALGIPLFHDWGSQGAGPNSPVLDRLHPSRGYTKDNVRVISHLANSIKHNSEPKIIRKVASWLEAELRDNP